MWMQFYFTHQPPLKALAGETGITRTSTFPKCGTLWILGPAYSERCLRTWSERYELLFVFLGWQRKLQTHKCNFERRRGTVKREKERSQNQVIRSWSPEERFRFWAETTAEEHSAEPCKDKQTKGKKKAKKIKLWKRVWRVLVSLVDVFERIPSGYEKQT